MFTVTIISYPSSPCCFPAVQRILCDREQGFYQGLFPVPGILHRTALRSRNRGFRGFFPGSWIQGSGLHLDIYATSSSVKSGLWLQLFSLHIPQAVQAPAGLLRYFLCGAVERICGHRRYGRSQNLQLLFRKGNHLLSVKTEQARCCVPCSTELLLLLRHALPWNKYSGSQKVEFLYLLCQSRQHQPETIPIHGSDLRR